MRARDAGADARRAIRGATAIVARAGRAHAWELISRARCDDAGVRRARQRVKITLSVGVTWAK